MDTNQETINGMSARHVANTLNIKAINKKTFQYYDNTDSGFEQMKKEFIEIFPKLNFNKIGLTSIDYSNKNQTHEDVLKIKSRFVSIYTGDTNSYTNYSSLCNPHHARTDIKTIDGCYKKSSDFFDFYSTLDSLDFVRSSEEVLSMNSKISRNKRLKFNIPTVDIIFYNGSEVENSYPAISINNTFNEYYSHINESNDFLMSDDFGGKPAYRTSNSTLLKGRMSIIITIKTDTGRNCYLIQGMKCGSGTLLPIKALKDSEAFGFDVLNDEKKSKMFVLDNIIEDLKIKTKKKLTEDSIHIMSLNSFINSVTSSLTESNYEKYTLTKDFIKSSVFTSSIHKAFGIHTYNYSAGDGRLFFVKKNDDETIDTITFQPNENNKMKIKYASSFYDEFEIDNNEDNVITRIVARNSSEIIASETVVNLKNITPKMIKLYVNKIKQLVS